MATEVSALAGRRVRIGRRPDAAASDGARGQSGLSPRTLSIIRWTQVCGQLMTVLFVAYGLGIELPLASLLVLIGIAATSTVWATRQLTPPHRLSESQFGSILLLDAAQIGAMLALTGGLGNPFALFLLFPAILAATTLGIAWCMMVCGMVVAVTSLLAVVPTPVTWASELISLPPLVIVGNWTALTVGTLLIAVYAWRIAEEARRMARALTATQLALEREQRLSHLDGLATAAAHDLGTPLSTISVLARELVDLGSGDPRVAEDARLLHQQARRCRDILARFADEAPLRAAAGSAVVPLSLMLERLCSEHQNRPVVVHLRTAIATGVREPAFPPAGEVRHGLANLLDNAVTYARSEVQISLDVNGERTLVQVVDDGRGFPPEILNSVGEPFVSTRGGGTTHGLGLFVACTFLTRSGAELEFTNGAKGASVTVAWPASRFKGVG